MNPKLKRGSHAAFVVIGKGVAKMLPDRIPVTFVGSDAVAELCESIGHRGLRKALVVTDAGLVEIGLVDRVTEALAAAGVEWSV